MSKRIVFKISPKGEVSIDEVLGYGSRCQEATAGIERKLGISDENSRNITGDINLSTDNDISLGA